MHGRKRKYCLTESPVMHYVHPDPNGAIVRKPFRGRGPIPIASGGRFRVACDPKRTSFSPFDVHRGTGDVRIVNCPECKATARYQEDIAKAGGQAGAKVDAKVAEAVGASVHERAEH